MQATRLKLKVIILYLFMPVYATALTLKHYKDTILFRAAILEIAAI
jgi:hypothetical protein